MFCDELSAPGARRRRHGLLRHPRARAGDVPASTGPRRLCRAYNLERALGTPAKIYYKFEGNNTSGSHKLNSAIAQAYYAKAQELTGITTETGRGPVGHGARRGGRSYFGLDLDVFMVKCSYEQKPFRRNIMETFERQRHALAVRHHGVSGARCWPDHPDSTGVARHAPSPRQWSAPLNMPENKGRYTLGSVLNQVVLHQSHHRAGELRRLRGAGRVPRHRDRLRGRRLQPGRPDRAVHVRQAAAASSPTRGSSPWSLRAAPRFTRGRFAYDFCRHGPGLPARQDVHCCGNGFHAAPPTTRAACATTA